MSQKKRGPKWRDIPKPINGLAALELSAELAQHAPDDVFVSPMSPQECKASSFLEALRHAPADSFPLEIKPPECRSDRPPSFLEAFHKSRRSLSDVSEGEGKA